MPEVLMHMVRLVVLPFWEPDPYQPQVGWLRNQVSLEGYHERGNGKPSFIPNLGWIRPQGPPRIRAHKIWRNVTGTGSRNSFNEYLLHLLPFRIVPNYKLVMEQDTVEVRRFFVYLTPQTLSVHVSLDISVEDFSRPLSRFEYYKCHLTKGKFVEVLTLSDLLKFVTKMALEGVIKDPSRNDLKSIWHTSFGLIDPVMNIEAALDIFRKTEVVSGSARKFQIEADPDCWKIISPRRSVLALVRGEVYSPRRDAYRWRDLTCHFNNWNDLIFIYYSVYQSLWMARQFIHGGGTITPTVHSRLMLCYDVHEKLGSGESGWQQMISELDKSYGGSAPARVLRDDLLPKGGVYVTVNNTGAHIGSQQIGDHNRMTVMEQHIGDLIESNPDQAAVLEELRKLTEVLNNATLESYKKDDATQKIAVIAEEAAKKEDARDKGKIAYFFGQVKSIAESVGAALPILATIGKFFGIG